MDPDATRSSSARSELSGASYLVALHRMAVLDLSTVATVLTVLAFNVIMLGILEVPTLGYVLRPDATPHTVARFKAALSRNGRRVATWGAAVIGGLLIVRGVIELLS